MLPATCNKIKLIWFYCMLHATKLTVKNVVKQNYFAIGNANTFSMQFVENMFLLQSHKKLSRVPEASWCQILSFQMKKKHVRESKQNLSTKGSLSLQSFKDMFFCRLKHSILNETFEETYLEPCQMFVIEVWKQHSRSVLIKRYPEIFTKFPGETPMPKYDFTNDVKQLCWNRTSTWVFSCKFAAYFQDIFL